MTKYEFLGELSRLLSDLPEEEREEAMQYYEDYFADAGREKEQAIIQELGSPERVAAKIRGTDNKDVEFGEQKKVEHPVSVEPVSKSGAAEDSTSRIVKVILSLILIIIVSPVIFSVAASVGGVIVAAVATIFVFFCAIFGGGIGLCIGGVVYIFAGLFHCITLNFSKGLFDIGAGFVMLPVGILLFYGGVTILAKLLPALWKLCERFWNWLCKTGRKIFS